MASYEIWEPSRHPLNEGPSLIVAGSRCSRKQSGHFGCVVAIIRGNGDLLTDGQPVITSAAICEEASIRGIVLE